MNNNNRHSTLLLFIKFFDLHSLDNNKISNAFTCLECSRTTEVFVNIQNKRLWFIFFIISLFFSFLRSTSSQFSCWFKKRNNSHSLFALSFML